jgi:acetylornithine deacetylase/succinyl-diaminopimelate desuccinylase-like protein
LCSEDAKAPILCALQAIDEDANFAENVNQLILFDFGEECGGKAADQGERSST